MSAIVGDKLPTIKPDDLVRTPSGRLCRCLEITAGGRRELQDIVTGERVTLKPEILELVHSAKPRTWPSRKSPD